MFIKQITIQGFKSYRDQTVVEPFSPKHNVVVGRNGSGKSNFFYAIRFVLSDMFSNMRAEERQSLLHEGAGMAVMSAYVEIIFDNSDSRIPIDRDEIALRRTIGLKKDEYFLDSKHVQKSDVMNLLESAGFSRSNPYYIVQQGKINTLALAKDTERLQLLKEVAGTSVYDERRNESLKIMAESESKQEKIEEVLKYIEERLTELEEEKEELKEYQRLDRDRRSLEYTIYDKELRDTKAKIEEIEAERLEQSEKSNQVHTEAAHTGDKIHGMEKEIKTISARLSSLTHEKNTLSSGKDRDLQLKAKLELDVNDLEETMINSTQVLKSSKQELKTLEEKILETEKELEDLLPNYNEIVIKEKNFTSSMAKCQQQRDDLYAKLGRCSQFKSKEERNKWIKGELKSLQGSYNEKQTFAEKIWEEIKILEEIIAKKTSEIEERNSNLSERIQLTQKNELEFAELKKRRDELTNERKLAWKEENDMEHNIQNFKAELNKAERNLQSTVPKGLTYGLDTVCKLARERKIPGVFGPVLELFECDGKFSTAVEVTAGNSLFHVVVDTDETASRIIHIMNNEKIGSRVTFMPLNRLSPSSHKYPDTQDAIPLTSKLNYDPKFKKVFEQIFGGTLVCRNIEVANILSKSDNLDCITLDGDQVNRRGALTGGFYDSRRSRMEAMRAIKEWRGKIENVDMQSRKLTQRCETLDQTISQVLGELQKVETRRVQLRDTFENVKLEVNSLTSERNNDQKSVERKRSQLEKLETDLASQNLSISSLKNELGSELLSNLSPEEQDFLNSLSVEIQNLTFELEKICEQRAVLENHKLSLENLLVNNIYKRRDETRAKIELVEGDNLTISLEAIKSELAEACENVNEAKERLSAIEESIETDSYKLKEFRNNLELLKAAEKEKEEGLQTGSRKMEKILQKRSILLQKKEECTRKIRELGSLPSEAFEKYQSKALKSLYKQLHATNEQLKKYSHVNKKALDQYVSFSDQREELLQRKKELDRGKESIKQLVDTLDMRKDEAIERTFKQVSKYFSEVFSELIPQGRATLIMQKGPSSSQETNSHPSESRVESYSGVAIRVTFTGKDDETQFIQQLSGGQKSMVALCLIFAIQRCDPAPFYLFDEIDQALDSAHRTAVAEMIHRLSENAQFITTTFRPEFLRHANKCYAITFKNKVSHCDCIENQDALDFIEEEGTQK